MKENLYIYSHGETILVPDDMVDEINQYLIAAAYSERELKELAYFKFLEISAKKEATVSAYKRFPNPVGNVPHNARKELTERRNEYIEELTKKNFIKKIKEKNIKLTKELCSQEFYEEYKKYIED